MRADICICTACKDMLIEKCLESISKYVDKSSIGDICICCTTDEALQKMLPLLKKFTEKQAFSMKLTQQDYNFAKCNNALSLIGSAECILFMNDDIELVSDAVTPCLKALEDDRVGTVGIRLDFPDGTCQHGGVFAAWTDNGLFRGVGHIGYKKNVQLPELWTVGSTGAFLMVRRSDFKAVGGFNESYKHCYEDVELNVEVAVHCKCLNATLNSVRAVHRESSTRQQAMCYDDAARLAKFMSKHSKLLRDVQLYTEHDSRREFESRMEEWYGKDWNMRNR